MDYSIEFVTMCEAAIELQDMVDHREITQKDFFAKKDGEKGKGIWLPRQDQLQEIILDVRSGGDDQEEKEADNGRDRIGVILEDIHNIFVKNPFSFTLEQACLCLFMKEIYFKSWNIISKQWETT